MARSSNRDKRETDPGIYPMVGERIRMSEGGRVVIPLHVRDALGVKPGDELVIQMQDGCLQMLTVDQAVRRAQAVVRKHVTGDRSLAQELIQERRKDAERE